MVYYNAFSNKFRGYKNDAWTDIIGGGGGGGGWTDAGTVVRLTTITDSVGIGTTSPSAKLDVSSTTAGFLLPRMTTV